MSEPTFLQAPAHFRVSRSFSSPVLWGFHGDLVRRVWLITSLAFDNQLILEVREWGWKFQLLNHMVGSLGNQLPAGDHVAATASSDLISTERHSPLCALRDFRRWVAAKRRRWRRSSVLSILPQVTAMEYYSAIKRRKSYHLQQHGWYSKTLPWVKEARSRKNKIAWFHLHEQSQLHSQ